ncbi:MAG: hypothetical protein WB608_12560 [Terracidiphilus sp.]
MNWFLILLVVLVFAISFFADYKWRRWMEARKAERQGNPEDDPTHRH